MKDQIKGEFNDAKGKIKREVGEANDDAGLQAEGLGDQIKGKTQKAVDSVKSGARDLKEDVKEGIDKIDGEVDGDVDIDRKRDVA